MINSKTDFSPSIKNFIASGYVGLQIIIFPANCFLRSSRFPFSNDCNT